MNVWNNGHLSMGYVESRVMNPNYGEGCVVGFTTLTNTQNLPSSCVYIYNSQRQSWWLNPRDFLPILATSSAHLCIFGWLLVDNITIFIAQVHALQLLGHHAPALSGCVWKSGTPESNGWSSFASLTFVIRGCTPLSNKSISYHYFQQLNHRFK